MAGLPISGIGLPILVLLALLSVVSIALILLKAIRLSGEPGRGDNRTAALQLLTTDKPDEAKNCLGSPRTAADRITVLVCNEIANSTEADIGTTLEIAGNAEAHDAFRHIRTLETIAMISPLLGLLGTVLGMIQAFRDLEMAEGAANAALLAGGIWQALLTTAAGLIVALPAAAGAALLATRAEAAVSEVETTIARILATVDTTSGK